MKIIKKSTPLTALLLILFFTGCYFQTPANEGSISIKINSKALTGDYNGYFLEVLLTDASEIINVSTDGYYIQYEYVNRDPVPISVNGETVLKLPLSEDFYYSGNTSGQILLTDLAQGRKYRLQIKLRYRSYYVSGETVQVNEYDEGITGISNPFEIVPGGNTTIEITLYNDYYGSGV
jgi:hypothetical protein